MHLLKVNSVNVLYYSYVIFFISTMFSNDNSAIFLYISNILIICLFCLFIFFRAGRIFLPKNIFYLGIIFCILGFVVIQPISKSHIYSILIFFKIMLVCLFFYQVKIEEKSFINFINFTYLFYLLISVLFWLGLIPNPNFNAFLIKDEFLVSVGSWSYYVLPGVEGSPANIDSYSAVVLLINLFIRVSQKSRKFFVICSVVGILLSLRLTAILGIMLLLLLWPLLKYRLWFLLFNVTAFISFLLLLYALHFDLIFIMFNMPIDISALAYIATHARSIIWEQQIVILLYEYQWYDYMFGSFNVDMFNVPTFQFTGAETGKSQSNPHNTYLLLFFRSPLLTLGLMWLLFINMYKRVDRKYYMPISFILLACYTNSAIISLENPIFIYLLVYSIFGQNQTKLNYYKT